MTARSQGHPVFQSQSSSTQHLRDRQRFFEDVLSHDVDTYYPQIHLLSDRWRPPLDSVSSMEVNIDSVELSEPLDISELEPSDTFQQPEDPMSPLVTPGDFRGIDYFTLHFPFSPGSGQQTPAHDSSDAGDRQEEAADEQSKEHILNLDSENSDHKKTPLSEAQ
ncbi:dysbindin domain-containing protein 2-like [Bufo gargarizans]|uniref:dysbindin domain-containing protein 2-like n=1 Tax=Bufo gargarizans TaxID=30331 RepID=UPI001CF34350|nr:dysbindin domain-containing protein 2-like [Bufo gargarizans]